MTLPKELTTVTPLSRMVTVIVFIASMIIGFGIGINYQEGIDLAKKQNNLTPATITKPIVPRSDETANWKMYKNKEYGYSINYPSDYYLEESYSVYFKKGPDSSLIALIEVSPEKNQVFNDEDTNKMSFEDFAIEKLKMRCSADGHNSSIFCDKVVKKIPIINKSSVNGYELYLNRVHERGEINKMNITNVTIGPFFVFNVQKETDNLIRGLFIIGDYGEPNPENEKILREVVNTLRF